MKIQWYVGIRQGGKREIFSDEYTPTADDYPQYVAVIGPHRSKRGAAFMRDFGGNNPYLQTSDDADRFAKLYGYRQKSSGKWEVTRHLTLQEAYQK